MRASARECCHTRCPQSLEAPDLDDREDEAGADEEEDGEADDPREAPQREPATGRCRASTLRAGPRRRPKGDAHCMDEHGRPGEPNGVAALAWPLAASATPIPSREADANERWRPARSVAREERETERTSRRSERQFIARRPASPPSLPPCQVGEAGAESIEALQAGCDGRATSPRRAPRTQNAPRLPAGLAVHQRDLEEAASRCREQSEVDHPSGRPDQGACIGDAVSGAGKPPPSADPTENTTVPLIGCPSAETTRQLRPCVPVPIEGDARAPSGSPP